jgi:excisionase family DNA binding protein
MDYITSRISSIAALDPDVTITIDGRHYEPLTAVATRLHMTKRTIYNWIDRGWLPHPVKLGSRVYFSSAAVDRHLAKIATTGK